MPDDDPGLAALEARRAGLYAALGRVGDFRRGALNAVWRKCGKPNCRCAQPGQRGHGPQYNLTRWAGRQDGERAPAAWPGAGEGRAGGGRARAVPGAGGADDRGERGDLRGPAAVPQRRARGPCPGGGKGGLCEALAAEAAAEVGRLAAAAAGRWPAGRAWRPWSWRSAPR